MGESTSGERKKAESPRLVGKREPLLKELLSGERQIRESKLREKRKRRGIETGLIKKGKMP